MTDEIRNDLLKRCVDNRTFLINKPIDDSLIEDICMHIIAINQEDTMEEIENRLFERKHHPIKIYINSVGGDASSMFSLINLIETSKTPIYTYCLGKAYSAGFMIFIAGHVRLAQKNSQLLYHQTSYVKAGEHQYHIEMMDHDKRLQELAEEHVLKYTKIPKKKLEEIRKSKIDWLFFACDPLIKDKWKVFDLYY